MDWGNSVTDYTNPQFQKPNIVKRKRQQQNSSHQLQQIQKRKKRRRSIEESNTHNLKLRTMAAKPSKYRFHTTRQQPLLIKDLSYTTDASEKIIHSDGMESTRAGVMQPPIDMFGTLLKVKGDTGEIQVINHPLPPLTGLQEYNNIALTKNKTKPLLSKNEGTYVKKLKQSLTSGNETTYSFKISDNSKISLGEQTVKIVQVICEIYQSMFCENTDNPDLELHEEIKKNPQVLTADARDAGKHFNAYGLDVGLTVAGATNNVGRQICHATSLDVYRDGNFGNNICGKVMLNRINGIPDGQFASRPHVRTSVPIWGLLEISDLIEIFLKVREFPDEVQKHWTAANQAGYLAYKYSFHAYELVFIVSESSFRAYGKHLNSLAEFFLEINKSWYRGTQQNNILHIKNTTFNGQWVLDRIIDGQFSVQSIAQWTHWLATKDCSFSYIKTKVAGVAFFFFRLTHVRIADYWSSKTLRPTVRFRGLDRKKGANYATPMVRHFLINDVIANNRELKCLLLPTKIADLFGPRPGELLAAKLSDFTHKKSHEGITTIWRIPKTKNSLCGQTKRIFQKPEDKYFLPPLLEVAKMKITAKNQGALCVNNDNEKMTDGELKALFKTAIQILKTTYKKITGEDIDELRLYLYTFRISCFNDLFVEGHTPTQIISLSGHASTDSLIRSYLKHADAIWTEGLRSCMNSQYSREAIRETYNQLTSLIHRQAEIKIVSTVLQDSILSDPSNPQQELLQQAKQIEKISPPYEYEKSSYGLLHKNTLDSNNSSHPPESVTFLEDTPSNAWTNSGVASWERQQKNLQYSPTEIIQNETFRKTNLQPCTNHLKKSEQELINSLTEIIGSPRSLEKDTILKNAFWAVATPTTREQWAKMRLWEGFGEQIPDKEI